MAITREKLDQALTLLGVDEQRKKTILGKRKVAKRFMPSAAAMTELARVLDKMTMATESPLIRDGAQNTLSTLQDARNSTLTGTTLAGPNGSGQYLVVTLSTTNVARTVTIASTLAGAAAGSTLAAVYGVLQNKPRGGEAADVGIFGVTKVVSGSSSIVAGSVLGISSTLSGVVVPLSTGVTGQRVGMALEATTAAGAVFTMALYGFGAGANVAGTA